MSDADRTPPSDPTAAPAWLDRLMSGPIWVALVIALFALVNYNAARHYRRWDWTSAQRFTLSPRSVEIARALREPVELYVLLSSRDPLYAETHELAERYAATSPKVRLHLIDPDRQREREEPQPRAAGARHAPARRRQRRRRLRQRAAHGGKVGAAQHHVGRRVAVAVAVAGGRVVHAQRRRQRAAAARKLAVPGAHG